MSWKYQPMYWPLPVEMVGTVVQMIVCFFTIFATALSFFLTARA